MNKFLRRLSGFFAHRGRQRGFTLIETLISVVLMTIIMIGLKSTMSAWWDVIDRSWTERYIEQYGNSTVEYIARNVVNATYMNIETYGEFSTFFVGINSDSLGFYQEVYSAHYHDGVKINGEKLFQEFPLPGNVVPHNAVTSVMSPDETIEITQFKAEFSTRPYPPYMTPPSFYGKTFMVTMKIKYTRNADDPSETDYENEMTFSFQVALKNLTSSPNT